MFTFLGWKPGPSLVGSRELFLLSSLMSFFLSDLSWGTSVCCHFMVFH